MTEKDIKRVMTALELTREQAIELLQEDEQIDKMTVAEAQSDLTAEQKKAAKAATITGSKKRTPVKRERKVDPDKLFLIELLFDLIAKIADHYTESERVNENEIHFTFRKSRYTVKLIKHRPQK